MNKPNFDDIKNAYDATGFKPRTGQWIDTEAQTACGMSVLAIHRGVLEPKQIAATAEHGDGDGGIRTVLAEKLEVDETWLSGFVSGYDDADVDGLEHHFQNELFADGFAVGSEVNAGLCCV